MADGIGPSAGPAASSYLQQLCTQNSPEALETGVSAAGHLLKQLQDVLSKSNSRDIGVWLTSIAKLQERSEHPRTVIGVIGSTGVGKSSVINALLDEERLLPTNCIRACTASPTEVSYNHSDDPQELYRAEIEFISKEDWLEELEVLFQDLLDSNGQISQDATNASSDAGIAYAKVKALYPQKSKEMIAQANPHDMANDPAVYGILGSTKYIKDETAKGLYKQMQRYVGSGEKSTRSVEHEKGIGHLIEYWPLIKVVRVRTKANVLSTGAVIVDLPGVQDSNVARAAVASNYMKSCTGIWIVTPINRAVDDKVAKTLLGDSFKIQLKYDGAYTGLTFICSKTDDISITEAAETLQIEGISEKWDATEKMERAELSFKSEMTSLERSKTKLQKQYDKCDAKLALWEDLYSQLSRGRTVYAPSANPKKRKRNERSFESFSSSDSDEDVSSDSADSDSSDWGTSQPGQSRQPLTEEAIEEHISSLKSQRKNIRKEGRLIESELVRLGKEMSKVHETRESIIEEIKVSCIKGRNNYSKSSIKQDFAKGVKELDQENSAEDDADFDPESEIRDYEDLARNFPVFCVSSRAYQKLQGRLRKDHTKSSGFICVEDTEIPDLQKHAKSLAEARRAIYSRSFLNEIFQLVNSMKLWSTDDDVRPSLTEEEKFQEQDYIYWLLSHLEKDIESSVHKLVENVRESVARVFSKISSFIPAAIEAAPTTAYSWGAPRNEGGLAWSTYKAVVRRKGVYQAASGLRDFNQDLFDPIWRNLATIWERTFQHRLPAALKVLARDTTRELEKFHLAAKARAESRQINTPHLAILSNQIMAHIQAVKALPTSIQDKLTKLQRESNRRFTQVICSEMKDTYIICRDERGKGSYARMKMAMVDHVETARFSMFRQATEAVRVQIDAMCQTEKQEIHNSISSILDTMSRDYMCTLVGIDEAMSREELRARTHIREVLVRGDKLFGPALGASSSESFNDMSQGYKMGCPGWATDDAVVGNTEVNGASGANMSNIIRQRIKLERNDEW
ncbi:hypothetical protein F4861DRAFT_534136 [Xylaria intraflava]|nr:hypothetical protein F4861DRAFT_534136 [Xylaria intraflava]